MLMAGGLSPVTLEWGCDTDNSDYRPQTMTILSPNRPAGIWVCMKQIETIVASLERLMALVKPAQPPFGLRHVIRPTSISPVFLQSSPVSLNFFFMFAALLATACTFVF